jgi:hypothetical protein
LFERIGISGLDPADCEMATFSDGVQILHLLTGSDFRLSYSSNYWVIDWYVIDGPAYEGLTCRTWHDVLQQIDRWCAEVEYVTETPDWWAELQQVPDVMTAAQSADASNAPFTAEERDEIGSRLDEIKDLLQEQFDLTNDQLAALEQRMDDAGEASERLGRKDWVMLFYGAVISTGMTDGVPPHVIQTVLSAVIHGIGHIFGLGGPPPIIST